jgi:hypothetical protein
MCIQCVRRVLRESVTDLNTTQPHRPSVARRWLFCWSPNLMTVHWTCPESCYTAWILRLTVEENIFCRMVKPLFNCDRLQQLTVEQWPFLKSRRIQDVPGLYGSWKFITLSATPLGILSRGRWTQPYPHPTYLRSILILSLFTPKSPKWSLPIRFYDWRSVHSSRLSRACYPPPMSSVWFDHPTVFYEYVNSAMLTKAWKLYTVVANCSICNTLSQLL